jgi:hypothetical protein
VASSAGPAADLPCRILLPEALPHAVRSGSLPLRRRSARPSLESALGRFPHTPAHTG